ASDEKEHAAEDEEALGRILMGVNRAMRDDVLDTLLIGLAGAHGNECTECKRGCYGECRRPGPTRARAAPDCHQGDDREDWQEHHQRDREMYDHRVQRSGKHRDLRFELCTQSRCLHPAATSVRRESRGHSYICRRSEWTKLTGACS